MKTYSTINHISKRPSVVALGCFDGVHLGHVEVIRKAREIADEYSIDCTVFTFDEPPKNFFLDDPVPLITDSRQKKSIIKKLGVDVLVSVPFSEAISRISAQDFFEKIIVGRLKASCIVCGFNYSFGAYGRGNVDMLKKLCRSRGIKLYIVPPVTVGDVTVSSSAIRDALLSGDTDTATALLGRPYSIDAVVISGQHLAGKLGFPTVNQEFPRSVIVLRHGVYVTRVTVSGRRRRFYGISNVGTRPTVNGVSVFSETHIFDLSEDLYGKRIKVEFLRFIRPEQKFASIDLLAKQVEQDIKLARLYTK